MVLTARGYRHGLLGRAAIMAQREPTRSKLVRSSEARTTSRNTFRGNQLPSYRRQSATRSNRTMRVTRASPLVISDVWNWNYLADDKVCPIVFINSSLTVYAVRRRSPRYGLSFLSQRYLNFVCRWKNGFQCSIGSRVPLPRSWTFIIEDS